MPRPRSHHQTAWLHHGVKVWMKREKSGGDGSIW
jgi:hypothetical protein